jgi:RNA recognition motif-containing protein
MECFACTENTFFTLKQDKPVLRKTKTLSALGFQETVTSPCRSTISEASTSTSLRESFVQINDYAAAHQIDESQWTTVMIRNIPNRYAPQDLLDEIPVDKIDFMHLPKASKTIANLGYAFVNFIAPVEAQNFIAEFEGHQWAKQTNSKKRAVLSFAKLQGLQENIDFYQRDEIASKLGRAPWIASNNSKRSDLNGTSSSKKLAEFTNKHLKSEEEYTTVMVRNIPTKYTQQWFVEEVQSIGSSCDFVHMPIAKKFPINLGYAFVNFVTPEEARQFIATFRGHQFSKSPNSSKRALVSYASLQGFEENLEFYSSKRVTSSKRGPWVLQQ